MYKVEVQTFSCKPTDWTSNGLTFDTEAKAEAYSKDLAWRWTAVKKWRVVEVAPEGAKELAQ
jgi:hypothetical protein